MRKNNINVNPVLVTEHPCDMATHTGQNSRFLMISECPDDKPLPDAVLSLIGKCIGIHKFPLLS